MGIELKGVGVGKEELTKNYLQMWLLHLRWQSVKFIFEIEYEPFEFCIILLLLQN